MACADADADASAAAPVAAAVSYDNAVGMPLNQDSARDPYELTASNRVRMPSPESLERLAAEAEAAAKEEEEEERLYGGQPPSYSDATGFGGAEVPTVGYILSEMFSGIM